MAVRPTPVLKSDAPAADTVPEATPTGLFEDLGAGLPLGPEAEPAEYLSRTVQAEMDAGRDRVRRAEEQLALARKADAEANG